MSEDVSATMRVGITVILVAALVATVLNLMVMSNSLLSNGQITLQSGIDAVSAQEFATYDNTKVSGTQVTTALSLFQGRDVAIVVQTKALAKACGSGLGINYGAILTRDGEASNADNIVTECFYDTTVTTEGTTNTPACYLYENNGSYLAQKGTKQICYTGGDTFLTPQAKTARVCGWVDGTRPTSDSPSGINDSSSRLLVETPSKDTCSVWRNVGAARYTGNLHNTNGLVDTTYDIIGTTELGNSAYILSSSRYSSILIEDATGSIIGILFKQLQ